MACKEQFKESHPMWDQNGFQKKDHEKSEPLQMGVIVHDSQ